MDRYRRSIRLRNYDYSHSGRYFVTICTQDRECLFGGIVNGEMVLNNIGNMIEKWWNKIPERFNMAKLDVFQIMPDHIHTIIRIVVGADPCVRPSSNSRVRPSSNARTHPHKQNTLELTQNTPDVSGSTHGSTPTTIGMMIQWFKTMSTNEYIKNVQGEKWKPFNKKLWQRNYYEHIIRNESELYKIRRYIKTNPNQIIYMLR